MTILCLNLCCVNQENRMPLEGEYYLLVGWWKTMGFALMAIIVLGFAIMVIIIVGLELAIVQLQVPSSVHNSWPQ